MRPTFQAFCLILWLVSMVAARSLRDKRNCGCGSGCGCGGCGGGGGGGCCCGGGGGGYGGGYGGGGFPLIITVPDGGTARRARLKDTAEFSAVDELDTNETDVRLVEKTGKLIQQEPLIGDPLPLGDKCKSTAQCGRNAICAMCAFYECCSCPQGTIKHDSPNCVLPSETASDPVRPGFMLDFGAVTKAEADYSSLLSRPQIIFARHPYYATWSGIPVELESQTTT